VCNRLSCYYNNGHTPTLDFAEPFALYAARTRQPDVLSAAVARTTAAHALLLNGPAPPGAGGLHALVGFYIDAHIPAMQCGRTMQGVYRDGIAPEHCSSFPVSCHPRTPYRDDVIKAWHSHQHNEAHCVRTKLMRKGGPAPLSVRYVSGLLLRCADDNMVTQPVVRAIILTHLLGNYKHSTKLIAPAKRMAYYNMSTPQLAKAVCTSLSTKNIHAMLTEFVCANTITNQPLLRSIGRLPPDSCFSDPATAHFGARTAKLHTIPVAYSVFNVMIKALNIHCTSLSTARSKLPGAVIKVILDTAMHARVFRTSVRELLDMGIQPADVEHINACFTQRKCGTLKMMRQTLKKMTRDSRDRLSLYLWALRQKLSVSASTLHKRIARLQRKALDKRRVGSRFATILVCSVCSAPKTAHVEGIVTTKTKVGTSANMTTGELVCNACNYSYLTSYNMVGRALMIGPLGKGPRSVVVVCCRCARLTASPRMLGMYPLCGDCHGESRQAVFSPPKCLCGRAGKDVNWNVAKQGNDVRTFRLCAAHERTMRLDRLVSADDIILEMTK
jgi:hypothetical protein